MMRWLLLIACVLVTDVAFADLRRPTVQKRTPRGRALAAPQGDVLEKRGLRWGIEGEFNFLGATVPAGGKLSTGMGFGGRLLADIPLGGKYFLWLGPSFQILNLKRTLEGGGSIADPTSVEFSQKVTFLGVQALGGMYILGSGDGVGMSGALQSGFEYLHPLSSSQTDSLGGQMTVSAPEKELVLLMGGALESPIGTNWAIVGSLRLFYNLVSSQSKLFGARVGVAVKGSL